MPEPFLPPTEEGAHPLMTIAPHPAHPREPEYVAVMYNKVGRLGGQVIFINYDLSAWANHTTQECDGDAPDPAPDYDPGTYGGRVEIMRAILEDIFDLDPNE
jgi:hypothetical protein